MGQRCCCRPSTLKDPKHTLLLNQIYTQAQENVKIDYDDIKQYFAKKGYIKTLCDYLSSHLNLISPTVLICKNKQISVRSKPSPIQLLFACTTTLILEKIVKLYLEVKVKSVNKHRSNLEQKQVMSSKIMESQNKKVHDKQLNQQSTKVKQISSSSKIQISQFNLLQDQIISNIIEASNQLMKQTIKIKNDKNVLFTDKNKVKKKEEIQFKILLGVQEILSKILEEQQNFLKANYIVIQDILNNLINIMVMFQRPSERMNEKSNIIKKNQVLGLSPLNTPGSFIEHADLAQPKTSPTQFFTENESNTQLMRKLSLENYYKLIKKANLHLANANFYKSIVKVHLPLLLKYWAGLVIESDNQMHHLSSISSEKEEEIDSSEEQSMKQKNIKFMDQVIQSIILEFFNCYFSFRQSEYIYRQLMRIFDKLYFNRVKIAPLEKLVFHSLRNYDLKQSVISKWFDYQLNYLGCIITITNRSSNMIDSFYTERKSENEAHFYDEPNYLSDLSSDLNFIYQNYELMNCFREENIVGCLRTIFKWIQHNHVNIQDILTYQHTKLLTVILSNLAWGSPVINQEIYKLINLLILNDIRTFGHLVNTAIDLINKLKIPTRSEVLGVQNWEYFVNGWQKRKIDSTEQQELRKSQQNLKIKSSTTVLKFKNSSVQVAQLISVQNFIDEIISIASYPFLNSLKNSIIEGLFGFQSNKIKKRTSMNAEYINPMATEFKRTDSFMTIQQEQEQANLSEVEKNNFTTSSKSTQNFNLCRSVFEETLDILFKDIDFRDSKIKYCYLIKLSSLVLASNVKPMVDLVEKVKKTKDHSFSLHFVNIINKFLAKFYKQIKKLSSNLESSSSRLSMDKYNQSNDFNQGETSKEEQHRNSLDKKNLQTDLVRKKLIYDSVSLWLYPALTFILSHAQKNERVQNVNEQTMQREYKLKFLLGTSIKIYFRNLINISQQNLQYLHSSLQQDQAEPHEDNQSMEENNLKIKNKVSRQFDQDKESIVRSHIPIIQVYKVYDQFYNKFQLAQAMNLNEQQIKSVQDFSNQRRNKKLKTQGFSKQNKFPEQQQAEKIRIEKPKIQQIGEKINERLANLEEYEEDLKQKMKSMERKQKKIMKKTVLDNIQSIQEFNIRNEVIQNKNTFHETLKQSFDIIFNPNLCHLFFFLVDEISREGPWERNETKFILSHGFSWENFIENHLVKNQKTKEVEQEIIGSQKCSIFSRVKDRINTNSKNQNEANLTQSPTKQKLKETNHTEGTQQSQLNSQNFLQIMPQLVAHLESKYSHHPSHTSHRKLQRGNSSTKPEYFNFGENQFKIEQSDINSSELKSKSVEGSSFNQIMSDIRKH